MVIFHSFVSLPEGNISKSCENSTIHWLIIHIVTWFFPVEIAVWRIYTISGTAPKYLHMNLWKNLGLAAWDSCWIGTQIRARNNRKKTCPLCFFWLRTTINCSNCRGFSMFFAVFHPCLLRTPLFQMSKCKTPAMPPKR
jgi:hypothetical protein